MTSPETRWSPFIKQVITVALLVGVAFLLFRVSVLIGPVILALLLAYVVSLPIKRIMSSWGWSRSAAVIVTELIVVLLVLTVPAAITPWLVNAVTGFGAVAF